MKKTYTLDFCLEDLKSGKQAIEVVFDMIAKVKAAVFAQAGEVLEYSYSNVFDPMKNIDGNTGTISFLIRTHDDYDRELVVEHWLDSRFESEVNMTYGPNVYTMISFRRSANTTGPSKNLIRGVEASRMERGRQS